MAEHNTRGAPWLRSQVRLVPATSWPTHTYPFFLPQLFPHSLLPDPMFQVHWRYVTICKCHAQFGVGLYLDIIHPFSTWQSFPHPSVFKGNVGILGILPFLLSQSHHTHSWVRDFLCASPLPFVFFHNSSHMILYLSHQFTTLSSLKAVFVSFLDPSVSN